MSPHKGLERKSNNAQIQRARRYLTPEMKINASLTRRYVVEDLWNLNGYFPPTTHSCFLLPCDPFPRPTPR